MSEELSNDELTCLAIAAHGENMLQIGRWEAPIQALVKRGLMRSIDKFNNVITPKGAEVAAGASLDDDEAFARKAIEVHNAQVEYKAVMEAAAQHLVRAAKKKQELTGQFPNQCAYDLAQQVLKRALEILG